MTGQSAGIIEVEFLLGGKLVVAADTGSVWDIVQGVAAEGSLGGAVLRQIPYVSTYDWAWLDFFPHSSFYQD